jgi:hypothetical protein
MAKSDFRTSTFVVSEDVRGAEGIAVVRETVRTNPFDTSKTSVGDAFASLLCHLERLAFVRGTQNTD